MSGPLPLPADRPGRPGARWLEEVAHDLRSGVRTFLRDPVLAATVVATLALAVGASTTIFSVVNGVLLRPLPFEDPDRLVQVSATHPLSGLTSLAWTDLDAFRERGAPFQALAAYQPTTRHLEGPSGPERLTAVVAEAGLFSLLGARALVGRTFAAGDAPDVAVISAALWRRRFGGDPSLPGTTIVLDGQPRTLLGVMSEDFQFPYGAASLLPGALPESRTDVWIPDAPPRRGRASHVVGRLRADVSFAAAEAELATMAGLLEQRYPDTNGGVGFRVAPLADAVVGPLRGSLWMLFAAAGLVLVAACANVANLLLARTAVRARELATRGALGASRLRLARQLLSESLILALAGGLAALVVAGVGIDLVVVVGGPKIPRAHEVGLDWHAFAFLLLACVTAGLLFGLGPALAGGRSDARHVAGGSGVRATMGRGYRRLRDGLVATEVALAFVLSFGAAIVVREAVRLRGVDPGMATENVLSLHVTPRSTAGDYYAIERRVRRLPGVRAAGFTQLVPLQNWGWEAFFSIDGRPEEETGEPATAGLRYVTPGYFDALRIPVVRGRGFTDGDDPEGPPVIVVNEALVRRYFPGEDPVGRETDRGTIVGVVGDVRGVSLDRPPVPELYYPAAQNVTMASDIGMSLLVRADADPTPLIDAVRSVVREVNPALAVFDVRTMDRVLADSLWEMTLYRWLVGAFAALVVVLAVIGLYGLTSYAVTSGVGELAVRLALGSGPSGVARRVLGRGARLAVTGLAAGVVATLALAPWAESFPFAVRADASTYAAVAVALLGVALLACVPPAIRVSGLSPARALRHD